MSAALSVTQQAAIAKVSIAGILRGTAFLIAPGYAITARHVVLGVQSVNLTFGAQDCQADVIEPDKPIDWALLELKAGLTTPPTPLMLRPFDRWHLDWVSYGFGGEYQNGGPIKGDFYTEGEDQLALRCETLKEVRDAEGYSGAPIITPAGTIGVMSYTRKQGDRVSGGYLAGIPTSRILESWPKSHLAIKPNTERAPYVTALCALLEEETRPTIRRLLLDAVGLGPLDSSVIAERIAERLVELEWSVIQKLLPTLKSLSAPLRDVLCSMWVCRSAARHFATIYNDRKVPIVQTRAQVTVRHHVMRAQGERHIDSLIDWKEVGVRLFYAGSSSGESLPVLVEKTLLGRLGVSAEEVQDHVDVLDPVFVVVDKIPTKAEVEAVKARFGGNLRIVGYEPVISPALLDANAAEQVKPDPDPENAKAARVLSPKEFI